MYPYYIIYIFRPIAVGNTLRRLVTKCACNQLKGAMGNTLRPHQLGFGTPLGAEAAVHSARSYLHYLENDYLILKIDFKNAFNYLHRDKMFLAVREYIPELLPLVLSAYGFLSSLFHGEGTILSSEWIQQGDSLGPPLLALPSSQWWPK